jgi:hypothetical protein
LLKQLLALLCLITLVITLYTHFVYVPSQAHYTSKLKETFDSRMMHLNSFEKIEDTLALHIKNNFTDTALVVNAIDDLLRARFFHSYSCYTYKDNWITTLLGNYVWQDFKFIVNPYDIIKHPMAACSQQGLVFQELLKRHSIRFATVQFGNTDGTSGHYAVNAYYKGSWHFFDSNMEPLKLEGNPSMQTIINDSLLTQIYPNEDKAWLESKLKNKLIHRVDENKLPGRRMYAFHKFTQFMSQWLWLLLGVMYMVLNSKYYIRAKATVLNKLTK